MEKNTRILEPLEAVYNGDSSWDLWGEDTGNVVAMVYKKEYVQVLAAAPDLLRALEEVLRCCVTPKGLPDLGKGRTTEQQEAMCAARAAIDNARGK